MTKNSIGIDLGGTNIVGALVSQDGEILERAKVPAEVEKGSEAVFEKISGLCEKLQASGTEGIGVGTPGPVSSQKGMVMETVNIPGWKGTPVCSMLNKQFGVPAYIGNDANVAALAEYWQGAAKGKKMAVLLTLGTGIGGGIIADGKILEGVSGFAGELGHMSISYDGRTCVCGKTGCIEAYASANSVVRRYVEKAGGDESELDAEKVCNAAQNGDAAAKEIIEQTGFYLGVFCGNLINGLNPDVIVLGGGLAGAGDMLFEPVRKAAQAESLPSPFSDTEILPAVLGNDAGILGAAALVFLSPSVNA